MSFPQPNKPHLRKCVCGARPRYGYEAHVKRCALAQMSRAADPPPVTAAEVEQAIEASRWEPVGPATNWQTGEVSCPKCGKELKRRGAHFHVRSCKGAT